MVYLAPVFLITIAYAFGELVCSLFCDAGKKPIEKCLIGTFCILIFWEIFTGISLKINGSFKSIAFSFSIFLAVCFILCLIFRSKHIVKGLLLKKVPVKWSFIACVLILLLQFIAIFIVVPDTASDYTLETVNTTLATDTVYSYYPGIGASIEYEIVGKGRLVVLPIFYSYLSKIFGGDSINLVYRSIPIWGIILNFMCYALWADALLSDDNKKSIKKAMFLLGLGILNIGGLFINESLFYYIMEKGFTGESICYNVVIPYIVFASFGAIRRKEYKNIAYIVMATAATAALTDIQTGLIPALCCELVIVVISFVYKLGRRIKCRK